MGRNLHWSLIFASEGVSAPSLGTLQRPRRRNQGSKALAEKRGIGRLEEAREILGVTAERLNGGRGNVVHYALPEAT
jgi:hypothetical protein